MKSSERAVLPGVVDSVGKLQQAQATATASSTPPASSFFLEDVGDEAASVNANSSSQHRYANASPKPHHSSGSEASALERSVKTPHFSMERIRSTGSGLPLSSPPGYAAGNDHDDVRGLFVDLQDSPSHVALEAAFHEGAAPHSMVPPLASLHLPPSAVTHANAAHEHDDEAAAPSRESFGASAGTSLKGSPVLRPQKETDRAASCASSSNWKGGPRGVLTPTDAAEYSERRDGCASPSGAFPSRDAEPLPASEARTRNRLPSGTHIRRRPRSVVRRPTGRNTASSPHAASALGATIDGGLGSTVYGALDATVSSSNVFGTPFMRSRPTPSASHLGANAGGSPAATGARVATGRKRDVLLPGTRAGQRIAYRGRSDPSPAPSRPPRARKGGQTNTLPTSFDGSHSAADVAPPFSPSSPAQVVLRGATRAGNSLAAQHRLSSEQSSPGASSPLTSSLERGNFFLIGERDMLNTSSSVATNLLMQANRNAQRERSGRSGRMRTAGVASFLTASAKPPSGRQQGSMARILAPLHQGASVHRAEELHFPMVPDYTKLKNTYVQMCTELGEKPNMDWIAGLSLPEPGEDRPQTTEGVPEDHQTSSARKVNTAGHDNVSTSEHAAPTSLLLQQHTPRGGVRPRIGGGAISPLNMTPAPSQGISTAVVTVGSSSPLQRATTPAVKRTKSPGTRQGGGGGGILSSSVSLVPKRSGSVGRTTTVNRPSIFGSSSQHSGARQQRQQYPVIGGGPLPGTQSGSSATAALTVVNAQAASPADMYAQLISKYCAENLEPLLDHMHSVMEQRAAVKLAVESFVQVAKAILDTPGVPTQVTPRTGGEGREEKMEDRVTGAPLDGPYCGGCKEQRRHSVGSGNAVAMAATKTPSPSSTSRRASLPHQSTASSLANTTNTTSATLMSKRPSSAAKKAATLSEALQAVQSAVVTLLSSMSDDASLAAASIGDSVSPSMTPPNGFTTGGLPLPVFLATAAASAAGHDGLIKTVSSSGLNSSTPTGVRDGPSETPAAAAIKATSPLSSSSSIAESPQRFAQFVRIQQKEVAAQLEDTCRAVRSALGLPMATPDSTSDRDGRLAVSAGPTVQLEFSDMLSTPFFIPTKYLDNLVVNLAKRREGEEGNKDEEESSTVALAGEMRIISPIKGGSRKSSATSNPKSSSSTAAAAVVVNKKKNESKLSSRSGSGIIGPSSTGSTPRARATTTAIPYAPFFTFSAFDADDGLEGGVVGSDVNAQSASTCSTEGILALSETPVATYVLHCIQSGTLSSSTFPLQSSEGERRSSRLNSVSDCVNVELSVSVGGGGGAGGSKVTGGKAGVKRSPSATAKKSGRVTAGGGILQARPLLSSSQKSIAPAKAPVAGKSRKKTLPSQRLQQSSTQSQVLHGTSLQEALDEVKFSQLAKAWTLWTALQGAMPGMADDAVTGLPKIPLRPSLSELATGNMSDVPSGRSNGVDMQDHSEGTVAKYVSTRPADPALSPTGATPANAYGGEVGSEADTAAGFMSALQDSPTFSRAGRPMSVEGSVESLLQFGNKGESHEDREEDGDLHDVLNETRTLVPDRTNSELEVKEAPEWQNVDDALLFSDRDHTRTLASLQSSEGTIPYVLSSTRRPQTTTAVLAPNSTSPEDEKTLRATASAPLLGHTVSHDRTQAAHQIIRWWATLQRRNVAKAQQRQMHESTSRAQRENVLRARRDAFLRMWISRWRWRRRLHTQKTEVALPKDEVPVAPTPLETDDTVNKSRRSSVAMKDSHAAASAPGTAAATSRERFQRAREQRKAALALAGAPSSTAHDSNSPLSASKLPGSSCGVTKDGSCGPASVPPLPLAASGISTFVYQHYQEESHSFTVSAMHRLLNAPPSLLYATCMAASRYPANAPMAYLDNTVGNTNQGNGGGDRQQNEAPPACDDRSAVDSPHHQRSSQRSGGADSNIPVSGGDDKALQSAGVSMQNSRWSSRGVWYIPFRALRHYVWGEYRAVIPCRRSGDLSGAAPPYGSDEGHTSAAHRGIADPFIRTDCDGQRGDTTNVLQIPATMRYESIVDPNELKHVNPVKKSFLRPFEQWGMAYHLMSRVSCAAAIYAWQLIFSHTPFDDAKQLELPTREEQQARLERVEDRNCIILECYGVHSEREWIREATKDLSFVGQLYLPNYDRDDPDQQKESRDNYDFVKNFLFQCFPNINKLADIQNFIVGAGLFFIMKEVFHYSKDSPSTRRVNDTLPSLIHPEGIDYIAAVAPPTSAPHRKRGGSSTEHITSPNTSASSFAAPHLLEPPRAVTRNTKCTAGLSGMQRAALQRYEQLRQLYLLCYVLVKEKEAAATDPRLDKAGKTAQQPRRRSRSSVTSTASPAGGDSTAKNSAGTANGGGGGAGTCDTRSGGGANGIAVDASLCLKKYLLNASSGPLAPIGTTRCSPFTSPAVLREEILAKEKAGGRRSSGVTPHHTSPHTLSSSNPGIQLVRVPHQLLRASANDALFIKEYEVEVSKSIHDIVKKWCRVVGDASPNASEEDSMLAAPADIHDAIDIAYPKHFLVRLSELLASELFGLHLTLSNCEDLDSIWQ